jgi:hypothetical protein
MVPPQSTSQDLIMSEKSNSFHWITLFAILGFMGTGFLFYPYGITRDSQASFAAIFSGFDSNVSWVGINNWMGWFVPGLWKWLRSLTGLDSALGVLHNMIYWVSMPVIYSNLFPRTESRQIISGYNLWFLAFAFFPSLLISLANITNNVFLLSTIAFALAILSFYPKYKSRWLLVATMGILLVATFIRRDAFLFVMPLVLCLGSLLTRRRLISAISAGFIFFAGFVGINKWVASGIEGYSGGINSTEIIAIFDLVGMSAIKQEVLIPDSVLKPEYQDDGKAKVLEQINAIKDLYNDHYFYHDFEVTERPYWRNGLTVQKALPVYLENWPLYLQFRANYVWQNFTRVDCMNQSAYFYQDLLQIMGVDAFPKLSPIVMKIQSVRVKASGLAAKVAPFLFQLWFYLALTVVSVYLILKRRSRAAAGWGIDGFLLFLLGNIWMAIGLLCIASVVIQLRYPFAYAFFVWPIFVYLLRRELEERRLRL